MKYTVLIQEVASKRIKELFLKIFYDYKDPINASNYIDGLIEAIYSLEILPNRCALVKNGIYSDNVLSYRYLLYKNSKIVFRVEEDRVIVVDVAFAGE